jgi:hypothetical protein
MASGAPRIVTHKVPAESCEPYARYFRREHPTALIWCRSEIDPPKGFIGDYIPPQPVVEYLPDGIDMLVMPTGRP